MATWLRRLAVLCAAFLPAAPARGQAVVPAAFTNLEGEGNNLAPFNTAACGAGGVRYQQLYAGGEVGEGTIRSIRFRVDHGNPASFGPVTFQGVTVRLSSTPLAPDDISQDLDENYGADTAIVFQGALALQNGASLATPRPFDVTIPVAAGFAFDGGTGDSLLLEIRITGCADFIGLDFTQASASVSRAFVGNAAGAVATSRSASRGLITQFVMDGPAGTCIPADTVLCIDHGPGDRRFRATVAFQTVQGGGRQGAGHALALAGLGVGRGGLFWFFAADNPEMLLKVIDGCAANGHFWIFYAAGTNVGLATTVTDTVTGRVWTRLNPDLRAAPPEQDVEALPCDG